jgi:hypothetical protein
MPPPSIHHSRLPDPRLTTHAQSHATPLPRPIKQSIQLRTLSAPTRQPDAPRRRTDSHDTTILDRRRLTGAPNWIAEGITPTVNVGDIVAAGQQIGTFIGHSIETGFAANGSSDTALASPA